MKLGHQRSRLEFGQLADEWAAEDGKPGKHEHLHELVARNWLGDFEDDAGRSCLFLNTGDKAIRFNRRRLLSALRSTLPRHIQIPSDAFIPDTHDFAVLNKRRGAELWADIESWDSQMEVPWGPVRDKVPWRQLAALRLKQYDAFFRETYLERLCISKGDFRDWCSRRQLDLPEFWFPPSTREEPPNDEARNGPPSKEERNRRDAFEQILDDGVALKSTTASHRGIAKRLVIMRGGKKYKDYSESVILKTLGGRYGPASQLGLGGVDQWVSAQKSAQDDSTN